MCVCVHIVQLNRMRAGLFRMSLMPLDAVKTMMQVEGAAGIPLLYNKVKGLGMGVLFHGSLASGSASVISHFPWFVTVRSYPQILEALAYKQIGRISE